MKKILCPTDFSEAAMNGIGYAAKFAHATGSTLTLFNVQSVFDLSPAEIVSGKEKTLHEVTHQLEEQSREVSKVFRISCYAEVEPSASVLSKAIEKKSETFDLIIMGTSGSEDLFRFFAGSNTYNAIRRSNTPAIVVPEKCVYAPVQTLVFAYDYLREAKLPMRQLVPWVKKLGPQMTVLQVLELAESIEVDEDLCEVQELIRMLYSEVPFVFDQVHSADVGDGIDNYMTSHHIDMLALCTKERPLIGEVFHRSVIKHISAVAKYPVFIHHS